MSANKLTSVAKAATPLNPIAEDEKLASFTFILESRSGYTAEGFYPNITADQYKRIIAALEDTELSQSCIIGA